MEENEEETITIGTNVPKSVNELLEAIIMANTHRSKSQILREALEDFLENHIDKSTMDTAKKILSMREQNLKIVQNNEQ
ncbi:MAG: hypothetical protein AB1420_15845 [Bacillota bacterium]